MSIDLNRYFVVDVEADGPYPGFLGFSMVCFGAVNVGTKASFYGTARPISTRYIDEALAISGITREEHDEFPDPGITMEEFAKWIKINRGFKGRPIFWSDNLAFDWQWINWYFHHFVGENPFGYSGRRINDLYCGIVGDLRLSNEWKKKYRRTAHTHNPVDDAMGNAEALESIIKLMKRK